MAVKAIPDGYDAAIPYLSSRNAAAAIEFYTRAFGARELMRHAMPDGRIGHAEVQIGNAKIMLADEFPEMGFVSPQQLGGTPVGLHVYVEDVDALVRRAADAGARVLREPADQFYGDRAATLEDPDGHRWFFSTHIEDVSPEEMQRRGEEAAKGG